MTTECPKCDWIGGFPLDHHCPNCGRRLTLQNTDEADDHYEYDDEEESEYE